MCQIIALNNNKLIVPLKKVDFAVKIVNMMSNVTVTQYYENNNNTNIEAKYKFSMPSGSTVYNFIAYVGDKIIKTVIKEKSEAKKIYQNAIETGDSAYYMEETDGDIFTCLLGNIPAKTNVNIEINYTSELKTEYDAKNLRFNLPISTVPRYVPKHASEDIDQLTVNPVFSIDKQYDMFVHGSIYMSDGIDSIESVGYKINHKQINEYEAEFQFENLETDDVVIVIKRKYNRTWAMSQVGPFEKYRHVTFLNICPEFNKVPQIAINEIHYTLILDCSSSMSGSAIENCKKAANFFVAKLPIGSRFDLYKFNDSYEKFISNTERGTFEYKVAASNWISQIDADGGTEVLNVLKDAMNLMRNPGVGNRMQGVIIFISDGGVTNTSEVFNLVKSYPEIRIFTLGIGSNVSQELIQKMADYSNGIAEWIANDMDNIDAKVDHQLRRAQQRVINQNIIKVHTDGLFRMIPENVPVIYENTNNIVYILSENSIKSITYEYFVGDQIYPQTLSPQLLELDDNSAIHRLAGTKLIKLMNNHGKDEIIDISKILGILSKHTSFIGVEIREEFDKQTNKPVSVDVPVQISGNYVPKISHYGTEECAFVCRAPPDGRSRDGGLRIGKMEHKAISESMDYEDGDLGIGQGDLNALCSRSLSPVSATLKSGTTGMIFSNISQKVTDFFHSFSPSSNTKEEKLRLIDIKLQETQYKSAIKIDDDVLPKCRLLGTFLTAETNGILDVSLKINDYVVILKDGLEGIYKVMATGSANEPWVLQLI
jgi:hypothetical protein